MIPSRIHFMTCTLCQVKFESQIFKLCMQLKNILTTQHPSKTNQHLCRSKSRKTKNATSSGTTTCALAPPTTPTCTSCSLLTDLRQIWAVNFHAVLVFFFFLAIWRVFLTVVSVRFYLWFNLLFLFLLFLFFIFFCIVCSYIFVIFSTINFVTDSFYFKDVYRLLFFMLF